MAFWVMREIKIGAHYFSPRSIFCIQLFNLDVQPIQPDHQFLPRFKGVNMSANPIEQWFVDIRPTIKSRRYFVTHSNYELAYHTKHRPRKGVTKMLTVYVWCDSGKFVIYNQFLHFVKISMLRVILCCLYC